MTAPLRLALLSLCLLLAPPLAGAKETIRWILYPAFPPARIDQGPSAGQGIIDFQLSWLISQLSEFDNVVIDASNARAFHEIADHDGQCVVDVFDTPERRQMALFSRPALIHRPPGLLVRSDRLAALARVRMPDGAVDPERLARLAGLSGVVDGDRNFGPEITHFLETSSHRLPHVANVQQALAMIGRGRADYTFGYAIEGEYYRQVTDPAATLTFLPVAGTSRLMPSYIACSNGAIGEKAIKAIDRILEQPVQSYGFLEESRHWFDPAEYLQISTPANWGRKGGR